MIDLATCDDFCLGSLTIRPSLRELVRSDGASSMVEPKVMQMLVALARTPDHVVSRDKLIAECWGNRIVGEDAINRIIGKLRRAAEGAANNGFRVETISRVGLRIVLDTAAPKLPTPPLSSAAVTRRFRSRTIWTTAAAVWIGLVAVAMLYSFSGAPERGERARPSLPPAVTDLETRGLSAMFENTPEQTAEGVGYLRQAAALAPRSAPIWGSLAMSYVLSLGWTAASERAAMVGRVRGAAAGAQAVDPSESRSAAAFVSLEPTFGHWDSKSQALRAWTRRSRLDEGPLRYQQVQFLVATGHTRDALAQIEPLAKASPLVPWIRAMQIDLLAANGRFEDADQIAAEVLAIWPHDRLIWFTCFDLAAFNGRPERALGMAADAGNWPKATSPEEIHLAARTVAAMTSRDPAAIRSLLIAYRKQSTLGQAHTERALRMALALKAPREALIFARQLYQTRLRADPRRTMLPNIGLDTDTERPTAALFLPPARQLWSEPEFLPLMSRIGLLGFWRRNSSPDLCTAIEVTQRCRAAKLKVPTIR